MWVRSLGWEDPLEEGMATHSSILAGIIPWTEEPGRLQPKKSQGVKHDWPCTCVCWANSTMRVRYPRPCEVSCQLVVAHTFPINKPIYSRNRKKFFVWAKLRTIAWETASQITLRNCSIEAWFQCSFMSCQNKKHHTTQGYTPSRFQNKKPPDQQWVRMALAPGKGALLLKEDQHWCPKKQGI